MKKLSISSQIVIIFIFIMLLSVTVFSALVLTRVNQIAEQETFTRLLAYSSLVDSIEDDKSPANFRDMPIAYVRIQNENLTQSNDLDRFINGEDLQTILEECDFSMERQIILRKKTNFQGKTIYYAYATTGFGRNQTVIITDSVYVSNMVRSLSLNLIFVFFIIIFLAIFVIAAWGNMFVRRLHRIRNHILYLPKTEFSSSYIDDGGDEVGELSRAVEEIRKEIQTSEQTKREMLQNISHDFKTPIAVIKSYAEAQQDGMAGEDSSKIIINQAEILNHKVTRLLQYNSLEYLQKDREFEDVDMKEVILEVIQNYKFQTTIDIELDLTEDIYFKGYRENYYTVVDNIVDNAKRYAKSKIKIILKKDRLRIYNDGEPIDEQFIQNAFKPYEKGSKGEFGLGMSIVKKTVDFFGMELIVKNETVGVSFILTKPKN